MYNNILYKDIVIVDTAETKWNNSFTEYAAFNQCMTNVISLVIHRNVKEERES